MNRVLVAALALSAVLSGRSDAQADERWYVQAVLGGSHLNGGEYYDLGEPIAQGAVAVRIARLEFANVLLGFKRESVFGGPTDILVCYIGSHGQCIPRVPQLNGSSGDVELSRQFWNRLTLEGSVGYGLYDALDGGGSRVRTRTGRRLAGAGAACVRGGGTAEPRHPQF